MDIISGKIVKGHGVASGRARDPRFPEGTLALQWPIFEIITPYYKLILYNRDLRSILVSTNSLAL